MAALVWLIIGVLLMSAEMLSGDFVLLMLGGSAVVAAGVAAVFSPLWIAAAVFALVSIGLVSIARPALKRRLHAGPTTTTNVAALIGGRAIALTTVDTHGGRVKIGGEEWSARTYDDRQVIEPGTPVTVMDISGATAVVWAEG
jgi:membrane protein implicated in regulation of membrane protease activity